MPSCGGKAVTLRRAQLRAIADGYAARLPRWNRVSEDTLARLTFPIVQGICLNRSSSDDYRPVCFLVVLVAHYEDGWLPWAEDLKNRNGSPGRSVPLRNHEREYEDVLAEMIRQFEPSIVEPLDVRAVVAHMERTAHPVPSEARDLAALHAYFGNLPLAEKWCETYFREDASRPGGGSETEDYKFVTSLVGWLRSGDVDSQLEAVAEKNLKILGIPQT